MTLTSVTNNILPFAASLEETPSVEKIATASSYRVSARRYRPKTFSELIGQQALVQTLSNGIKSGRLPHAFIFTGIRGVGKTTTARILARSLNCVGENGDGQETIAPCGQCDHCRAIDEDRHLDVIEMDAASRTGVDDIREVIEAARYKAVSGRYKIYIIDEVHMLSKNAFNALLKTLEEPPAHVKFIFATTEIRKVPQTILSRCMRFYLKRIDPQHLIDLFTFVCKSEDALFEEQALALIARAADGSARDGLSILDQVMTTSSNHVTIQAVQEMLGLMDKSQLIQLFKLLIEGKVPEALQGLENLYKAGAEPLSLLRDLLDLSHWITMIKVSPPMLEDPTLSSEEKIQGRDLSDSLTIPMLTRFWQILLKGVEEIQFAPSTLQGARMILVRLAYLSDLPNPEEIVKFLQQDKETSPSQVLSVKAEIKKEEKSSVEPLPQTFEKMVDLFHVHNEPLVHSQLLQTVQLVKYEPGFVTLHLSSQAPKDLTISLVRCLKQWTGHDWIINISQEQGQESLHDQHQARHSEIEKEVSQQPLVKAVLETFPGTIIKSITEIKG